MRYEWWSFRLSTLRDEPARGSDPPLLCLLSGLVSEYELPLRWLTRQVEAQLLLLTKGYALEDKNELDAFSEYEQSSILYLMMHSAGLKDVRSDHVASHVGKALGIVKVLTELPRELSFERNLIPISIQEECGIVGQGELIDQDANRPKQQLVDAVFKTATLANNHLHQARKRLNDVPREYRSLFLIATVCQEIVSNFEKVNFNIFHPLIQSPSSYGIEPLKVRFKLWNNNRKETI